VVKKFKYSIVYYDRKNGTMDYYIHLPMDGVDAGTTLPEFLKQAGDHGWQMCGGWNTYLGDGIKRAHGSGTLTDPEEVLELIFMREA
jgi:hypothetical protein